MSDVIEPVVGVPSKAAVWTGRVIGGAAALLLLVGGVQAVTRAEMSVKGMADAGYPPHVGVPLGVVTVVSAVLYLVPQTAVLGGLLLTAYLGGAVATHARMGDPWYMLMPAVVFGVLLWAGLLLRDRRLRALLPLLRV